MIVAEFGKVGLLLRPHYISLIQFVVENCV